MNREMSWEAYTRQEVICFWTRSMAIEMRFTEVKLTDSANILEYDRGGTEGRWVKMWLQDWIVALVVGGKQSPVKYIGCGET